MAGLINKIFLQPTNNSLIQLFRYCFVGGFAFIVDAGGLFVLTEYAGIYYLLSATISFILGLVVNYLLSTAWIFKKSKLSNRWTEFLIYSVIGVVGLGLNTLFLWLFTDCLHIYYMLSKIITAALVMLWNFFARKIILFK
jgi:putative flippase GtrA